MRVGFWLVLLAAASGVAFAAEDPTESLPGVLDLSELTSMPRSDSPSSLPPSLLCPTSGRQHAFS